MAAIDYRSAIAAARAPSHGLRAAVLAAFSATGRFLAGGLRAVQTARMMQVLSAMSDAQLARIGVARADIPAYARDAINAPASDA